MVAPPLVPPMPATACAPVPSQPQSPPGWAVQSLPSPPVPDVPTADVDVQHVAALFDKVLSLCTASLANAGQAPHWPQNYSSKPRDSSRQPGRLFQSASTHPHPTQLSMCGVW
ncbi:hypothetical protein NHX12_018964 [Muraenolepis orangiensis]|uniref:Uncharacterized protein n=1 Tax=Muraenolepis orangiensis TaxID=630683 RepID=A0A9Q0EVX0_9TELE|nr:hypothetical protein NHX12_018964 [Muraenolepis orangiensis]